MQGRRTSRRSGSTSYIPSPREWPQLARRLRAAAPDRLRRDLRTSCYLKRATSTAAANRPAATSKERTTARTGAVPTTAACCGSGRCRRRVSGPAMLCRLSRGSGTSGGELVFCAEGGRAWKENECKWLASGAPGARTSTSRRSASARVMTSFLLADQGAEEAPGVGHRGPLSSADPETAPLQPRASCRTRKTASDGDEAAL